MSLSRKIAYMGSALLGLAGMMFLVVSDPLPAPWRLLQYVATCVLLVGSCVGLAVESARGQDTPPPGSWKMLYLALLWFGILTGLYWLDEPDPGRTVGFIAMLVLAPIGLVGLWRWDLREIEERKRQEGASDP